jgi:hypothetical protein
MDEQEIAQRFSVDIDALLHGGVTSQLPTSAAYRKVMELAKRMAALDFNDEAHFRASLRRRLLNRLEESRADVNLDAAGELDDEDLQLVAGGLRHITASQGCSLCHCTLSAGDVHGSTCPLCGHPVDKHR